MKEKLDTGAVSEREFRLKAQLARKEGEARLRDVEFGQDCANAAFRRGYEHQAQADALREVSEAVAQSAGLTDIHGVVAGPSSDLRLTATEEAQFEGVRFSTELGEFLVARRDGGIEVYLGGELVFSPSSMMQDALERAKAEARAEDDDEPKCDEPTRGHLFQGEDEEQCGLCGMYRGHVAHAVKSGPSSDRRHPAATKITAHQTERRSYLEPKDGERPGFTLRAADKFAPHALLNWIKNALTHNLIITKADYGQRPESNRTYPPNSEPPVPHEKIAGACEHLADMIRHQAKFGCKIPD